jgi:hypothetical protein
MADRPIIHARDHEWGGADPAGIVYEDVGDSGGGGGGGGGVVLKSVLLTAPNLVGLAPFGTNYFSFSVAYGDSILDFTNPQQPAALLDGVYIFTAVVTASGLTTPTAVVLAVGLGSTLTATSQENLVPVSGVPPTVSLAAATNMPAGHQIRLQVTPGDTAATYTVNHPVVTYIGAA